MKDRIYELGRLAAYLFSRVEDAERAAQHSNQPDNIIERLAAVHITLHQAANELLFISRDIEESKP